LEPGSRLHIAPHYFIFGRDN